jgi:hypothetical protein
MEGVLVKLNRGLSWQKLHSTTRRTFTSKLDLKFEKESNEMLYLEHGFVWCRNLDASGSRSKTPGKF